MDNDGDLDLLVNRTNEDLEVTEIHYYENVGSASAPDFGPGEVNPFNLNQINGYIAIPTFGDLDMDGDYDMLVGTIEYVDTSYITKLSYYENVGTPENAQMNPPVDAPFGLPSDFDSYWRFPRFVDIDADGDLDIMAGEYLEDQDGRFFLYENTTPVSTSEPLADLLVSVSPNPVSDELFIQADFIIEKIEIYNVLGKLVHTAGNVQSISMANHPKGNYFIKIKNDQGEVVTKKILKK